MKKSINIIIPAIFMIVSVLYCGTIENLFFEPETKLPSAVDPVINNTNYGQAYYRLGMYYEMKANTEENAAFYYEQENKINRRDFTTHAELMNRYYDSALTSYATACVLEPGRPEYYAKKGGIYILMRNYVQAAAEYRKELLTRSVGGAYRDLVKTYLYQNNYDLALQYSDSAGLTDPYYKVLSDMIRAH